MAFSDNTLDDLGALAGDEAAAPSELRQALIALVREARADKTRKLELVPVNVMIDALSQILNGDLTDYTSVNLLDLVTAAAETYPERDRVQIMLSFELCPEHRCDGQICRDDARDCPVGRGEL